MKSILRGFVAILLTFWAYSVQAQQSCQAEVFTPDAVPKNPVVASPNGRFLITLGGYCDSENYEGGWLRVTERQRPLAQYGLRDLSAGIYIKWAPDSRAFYLMWDDGGNLGRYHLRVFHVLNSSVREVRATNLALADFHRRHYCEARGDNVYAVRWLEHPRELLVATEIYETGDCGKAMGFITGYAVDTLDGRILRRYSTEEIKKEMRLCPSAFWPNSAWEQSDVEKAKAELPKNDN